MSLLDQIIEAYPELTIEDFNYRDGSIHLQDDGDGIQYVKKWEYSKPIPSGIKLGK
jgi:hypothetical protein